jgi:hypothetical protein
MLPTGQLLYNVGRFGRRSAVSIHQYLTEEEVASPQDALFKNHIPGTVFDHVPGVVKKKRTPHARTARG